MAKKDSKKTEHGKMKENRKKGGPMMKPRDLFQLAIVLLVVGLGVSCGKKPGGPGMGAGFGMGAGEAIPVTVVHPKYGVVTNWDEYPAHLEAIHTVQIKAQVGGYLQEIHFEDGAYVKKGDLLFVIDPRPYEAALAQARARRHQAEVQLAQAEDNLKRAEPLRGTRAISEEEYDLRSKAVAAAEAALEAAKAAEQQAELNLQYTRITAPVSGRIGRRLVSLGDYIQAGMMGTLLAELVTVDPIYCYFDVPDESFGKYQALFGNWRGFGRSGLRCQVQVPGEQGFPHEGVIDFYDNQVDRQTGTIRMRAVIPNPDGRLIPGQFVRVRIPASRPGKALLIPATAVLSQQGRSFVYVVNAQSQVEIRPIVTGRIHDTMQVVKKGLRPEDRVIVGRLLILQPGMKVQPLPPGAMTNQAGMMGMPGGTKLSKPSGSTTNTSSFGKPTGPTNQVGR